MTLKAKSARKAASSHKVRNARSSFDATSMYYVLSTSMQYNNIFSHFHQIEDVPENINEIIVEVRLVTTADPDNPHPNKLTGKNCNPAGIYYQKLKRSTQRGFTIEYVPRSSQCLSLIDVSSLD